ncbi:MAG TPA: chromosome segregation protein SMC [Burkholderiales bacterium]|nr:chromosome segregation protein SMC [Burkholderiales bacterium]
MRLTEIKLAGFKSFVDPTHVPIPGQLVGIVGPNGCGKSNIIDAVRWVLGESQARHLRGETMQDVIFNGSGARSPVGRSSVELVFDNSLGKAAGQWSSYAEISIKRILQRNGESSYYVNNTRVRRRDITDIFLGTGLGPRAYAIIEQGMISRIVEAQPEELRVFLEEAAGVSKYRERRHETELRLKDTRENLLRVADVRQELEKQLQHLEEQARVASEYRDLQSQLQTTRNLLWLLKKQDVSANRKRVEKEIQKASNELEGETARLREIEKSLERLRTGHYSAGDAVHRTQGELYAANAEVTRLEQNLQHIRESRQRLESQMSSLGNQRLQLGQHRESAQQTCEQLRSELSEVQQRVEKTRRSAAQAAESLPAFEQHLLDCQTRAGALQREHAQAQQTAQIEDTHRAHAIKMLEQLRVRHERLIGERDDLPKLESAGLQGMRDQHARKASDLSEKRQRLESSQRRLDELQGEGDLHRTGVHTQEQALAGLTARLDTLKDLQEAPGLRGKLQPWLAKHRLEGLPRLWQEMVIETGWENALESVLRERLNALALGPQAVLQTLIEDAPPAKLTVFTVAGETRSVERASLAGMRPLSSLVTCKTPRAQALLEDWLRHVYVAEGSSLELRAQLPPGGILVNREGHLFARYSVSFYAADSELHGVLARGREIEQVQNEIDRCRKALEKNKAELDSAQQQIEILRGEMFTLEGEIETLQEEQHKIQIEIIQLTQGAEQIQRRTQQINLELEEIRQQEARELQQRDNAQSNFAIRLERIADLEGQLLRADRERLDAEGQVNAQRAALSQAQHAAQEAQFEVSIYQHRINDIDNLVKSLDEQMAGFQQNLQTLKSELGRLDENATQEQLQQILQTRQAREQALAAARNALEEAARNLQQTDEQRLAAEGKLQPLRDRINDLRLKEQEARLNEDQYAEQLRGANEEQLNAQLQKGAKASALQLEITRLEQGIAALGAVNLAALEELQNASERKTYLDGQARDLDEAVQTLENAIRRIDRETRARLMETFDAINRHLEEMFPMLFGGGKAQLVLSGDEVLDSGVQVIAQPPGKKNSTIHLLSGGEKALAALALIFSLFQLNPAPFCMLDEVDAPLDDTNTENFCKLLKKMSEQTQFVFVSHNKITMEIAHQLIGITMQELGVSRVVAVDIEEAMKLRDEAVA